jgi:hypothetical protein
MTHLAPEQIADLARNTLPSADSRDLQQHVAECAQCAALSALYGRIGLVAAREWMYGPPEGIVRAVKAHFGLTQVASRKLSTFELLFDTFAQPMAAGARASVASARQLLYRVGTVYVDMRVDTEGNSDRASLVGQMLDSAKPGHPVAGVPVELLEGQKSVTSTSSNHNGEFQLEFAVRNNLRLAVAVDHAHPVYLPITGIQDRKRSSSSRGK